MTNLQQFADNFVREINNATSDKPEVTAAIARMREKFKIIKNRRPHIVAAIIVSEPSFFAEILLANPQFEAFLSKFKKVKIH